MLVEKLVDVRKNLVGRSQVFGVVIRKLSKIVVAAAKTLFVANLVKEIFIPLDHQRRAGDHVGLDHAATSVGECT